MSTYYPSHCPAVAGETRDQALVRMAHNCRDRAFSVLYRDVTGCWHITSPASPQVPTRTTRTRCECQGFAMHGVCSHQAVLLAHLGEIPIEQPAARAA